MRYTYYPGCSLKGTGKAYEESLLPVFRTLGVETQEIDDWNCCGATSYSSVDNAAAFALAARNLAIAEPMKQDLVAPCAACYLVLEKTNRYIEEHPDVRERVDRGLAAVGLEYHGTVRIRHPLDILVNDVGLDAIRAKVKRPLKGLAIAPYYGCQVVRPYSTFDHQTYPVAMDRLFEALGATVVHYPLKTKCCGGSLTGTLPDVGVRLAWFLIREAKKRGADVIATLCPLCHFNLDAYQDKIARDHEKVSVPVVYFTQLVGLAFGYSEKELGLNRNIVSAHPALASLSLASVG
jgi:heterodisulfide reductase subunit B